MFFPDRFPPGQGSVPQRDGPEEERKGIRSLGSLPRKGIRQGKPRPLGRSLLRYSYLCLSPFCDRTCPGSALSLQSKGDDDMSLPRPHLTQGVWICSSIKQFQAIQKGDNDSNWRLNFRIESLGQCDRPLETPHGLPEPEVGIRRRGQRDHPWVSEIDFFQGAPPGQSQFYIIGTLSNELDIVTMR